MATFIPRKISSAIQEAAESYPVITVTGPRQSGKTTLVKRLFPELPYYSLESPDVRSFAASDPIGFLRSGARGMILDEVQNLPALFSYIQTLVDADDTLRFVLTGSSNFGMLRNVTQSLSGRSAIFELLPLSYGELDKTADTFSLDELLFRGCYPAVWSTSRKARMLYRNYVMTYLERDVRNMVNINDLSAFQQFLRLCAIRIGSIFNATELSNEVGVSVNTIKSWLSVLQASYVVMLLQPYSESTRKRLTKSPKIYFIDTGLACSLLDIESAAQLSRDKMRGHLFENLVVSEALKSRFNSGLGNNLSFYRDSNGNEIDLILCNEGLLTLIEIKSSHTYHPSFESTINKFTSEHTELVRSSAIIYSGSMENDFRSVRLINYRNLEKLMQFCN